MALFLFLALLFASPVVANLGQRIWTCASDIENKCQNLKIANQCNTVSRCMKTEWIKPIVDDDTCKVCKTFTREAVSKWKAAASQKVKIQQIGVREALSKGCHSIAVQELAKQCQDYVHSYLRTITHLLGKEVTPDVFCVALGLCQLQQQEHRRSDEVAQDKPNVDKLAVVNDSPENTVEMRYYQVAPHRLTAKCKLCKTVMKNVHKLLVNKKVQKYSAKEIGKICSQLPRKYEVKCKEIITDIKKDPSANLQEKYTPKKMCVKMTLCSEKKRDIVLPMMVCDTCEEIMHQLQSAQKPGSKLDVVLSEVCNSYFDDSRSVCEQFIHSNEPQLTILLQNQEQSDVCSELSICRRQRIIEILGPDKCTWGPAYWCSAPERARECNTMPYCEKHGWS
ncbi:prosaposin-like [Scyliorhinus canicula]|uniref:prosaposin-like n=1 Tax=Scyliorhinus canicula TaxID=7830 RepID=UPI0018F759CF|nr:prosaposin-like [Scyliorhinus canicula]